MLKPPPTPAHLRPIWLTNIDDDRDHAVDDEEVVAGVKSRRGTYRAICGTVVIPPSLADPPHPRCRTCIAKVRARRRQHLNNAA